MASTSLARSGHQSTTEVEHAPRVLRGQRLFREHAAGFLHKRGTWFVPSENGCAYYAVRLGPVETCECADYEHRGGRCKHIHAASIAHAESSRCSCCGHRVLNRFLSEVVEEDYLLSWFVGDLLCADCIRAGYWS
jgi:hypothetical protein